MKVIYLLGYPVSHSVSPSMQNAAFQSLSLSYEYKLLPVNLANLERKIMELRDLSVAGFNVTIPYKISVMPLLDRLGEAALEVGSVNTVVNAGGCLVGYNTDSVASTRVLREAYGDLRGCRVVVLGAGGAARAVVSGLAPYASLITILARDKAKATLLTKQLHIGASLHAGCLSEATRVISSANILVNATPVGMHPNVNASPVKSTALHPRLLVFDLIYNPKKTRLLYDAETVGAHIVSGVPMLVYQGAEAFRLWTGVAAPEELMMRAAMAALGGA